MVERGVQPYFPAANRIMTPEMTFATLMTSIAVGGSWNKTELIGVVSVVPRRRERLM